MRTTDQLHLAVDAATNTIVAATLTTGSEEDTSRVGSLLDHTPGPIDTIMVDDAYYCEPIYQTLAGRDPAATFVIPPRSTALPGSTNLRTARPAYLVPCRERPSGLATENRLRQEAKAETAMSRYKLIFGDHFHARKLSGQQAEAAIGVAVLNRMMDAGRPNSARSA